MFQTTLYYEDIQGSLYNLWYMVVGISQTSITDKSIPYVSIGNDMWSQESVKLQLSSSVSIQ